VPKPNLLNQTEQSYLSRRTFSCFPVQFGFSTPELYLNRTEKVSIGNSEKGEIIWDMIVVISNHK
jgi:hypothetical protein